MPQDHPRLLLADVKGRIFCHPDLEATGMSAGHLFRLEPARLIKIPPDSRLFMLPSRLPVGYDCRDNKFKMPGCEYFGVAAFLSPGYTASYSAAYSQEPGSKPLPLFSYAAAAVYKNETFVSAILVDKDRRHDSRLIDMALVRKNIYTFRKLFPRNRLVRHLQRCALSYGCCGAQNFFLRRHEGPLPSSPFCNAACAGCISHQGGNSCSASQPRITFIPKAEEIAEIALFHIAGVKDTIVSFGQGCDGEPLLAGDAIERSIALIRRKTSRGLINMNTNASRPEALSRLFDAGLDSIRVSLNSARELYYTRYYKPVGYRFKDVIASINIARERKRFVSINYLTMPGFTDSIDEFRAFKKFIGDHDINMIQWRNLNFDPILYFKVLRVSPPRNSILGIEAIMNSLKKRFPNLMTGYFNPARGRIK